MKNTRKAICLAILLCAGASAAFAQTYFGMGTGFGIEPSLAIPESHSVTLQQLTRRGISYGGFSLSWISLQRDIEGSAERLNGILGGPQFGFWEMGPVSFFAGGGIGARFGRRVSGESGFAWKVDGGLIVWIMDAAYVQGGMSYDNVRSGWSASVGVGLKTGNRESAGRHRARSDTGRSCE
ncbi:MAG: hypothetical protein FWD88_05805 [Treponema sp.]|nr:hypothetical protein [Treponema sp.]